MNLIYNQRILVPAPFLRFANDLIAQQNSKDKAMKQPPPKLSNLKDQPQVEMVTASRMLLQWIEKSLFEKEKPLHSKKPANSTAERTHVES